MRTICGYLAIRRRREIWAFSRGTSWPRAFFPRLLRTWFYGSPARWGEVVREDTVKRSPSPLDLHDLHFLHFEELQELLACLSGRWLVQIRSQSQVHPLQDKQQRPSPQIYPQPSQLPLHLPSSTPAKEQHKQLPPSPCQLPAPTLIHPPTCAVLSSTSRKASSAASLAACIATSRAARRTLSNPPTNPRVE